jgi:hypothetical protein
MKEKGDMLIENFSNLEYYNHKRRTLIEKIIFSSTKGEKRTRES